MTIEIKLLVWDFKHKVNKGTNMSVSFLLLRIVLSVSHMSAVRYTVVTSKQQRT